jgi:hypothetical protein
LSDSGFSPEPWLNTLCSMCSCFISLAYFIAELDVLQANGRLQSVLKIWPSAELSVL